MFKYTYGGIIMNTSNITNYKPKDFAELIGVSVKTLQRWDREGILEANRTPTDRRYYTYDQYLQFKGIKTQNDIRQVVIYARVSTKNQKDDLQNQVSFLRQFCNARGIIVDQCIEEYGSGLNYNRKKWNKLLDEVMEQKIKTIIITHKDRFVRFGYDWFEKFCMKFNTTIVIVNNEELSPQEELVQDIVSILHVFSCRLYGLRKYKKQIERDEEIVKELPTPEQKIRIHKTIGTCRYVYNFYLCHNKTLYDKGEKFMTGKSFSVWLNNEYLPNNPDKAWIKEVYSKAVKRSIEDGCTAFTRFFKHQSDFPKFKKKGKSDVKMYFVRNNPKDCVCERHRLKIPTLGWVRIKEKGYIPTTKEGYVIKSGTVSIKADRYYVSVLVELPDNKTADNSNEGIGIDLGLKDFATVSNGKTYKNINKSEKLKKLEKQLIREQRSLSRKYENLQKGESTQRANIQKQKLKVQKLHHRIDNIRTDYINKTIAEIVKTKPSYITIEDLNVKGMMKNRHLSKAVASQKFYEFRIKLQAKCNENGIELRVADRWYPSSKTCHCCKNIRKDLKLSDRIFKCDCGYIEDRDFNAALNLRDAMTYEVA